MQFFNEITVVVVCYNSKLVIADSIEPLINVAKIIIVDNASGDGSIEFIKLQYPNVQLILNERNMGFGSGINVGFRASNTKYTLVISPDTILGGDDLEKLYHEAERNDNAAIVAPSLVVPKTGKELWVMASDEMTHRRAEFDADGAFCTWFMSGAVMLCRTDYFNEVGGFDENIFLYNEDLDLSKKISIAGYAMIYVPEIEAKHLNSQSAPPSNKLAWQKNWNFAWSFLYVLEKYNGITEAHREARSLLLKKGLKALFYMLVLDKKRFMRDFSSTHGVVSYLLSRKPRHRR